MEAIGDVLEIFDEATGPTWLETIDGSRFPVEYKETRQAIEREYTWKDSNIDKGENISNTFGRTGGSEIAALLRWEKKVGRRLLSPRTNKGVSDLAPVLLELGDEEGYDTETDDEDDDSGSENYEDDVEQHNYEDDVEQHDCEDVFEQHDFMDAVADAMLNDNEDEWDEEDDD
jgi:hypothetical protein